MLRVRRRCSETRCSHRRLLLLLVAVGKIRNILAYCPSARRGRLRGRGNGERFRSAAMAKFRYLDEPSPVRGSDDVGATNVRLGGAGLLFRKVAARFASVRPPAGALDSDEPEILRSCPGREKVLHGLRAREGLSGVRRRDVLTTRTGPVAPHVRPCWCEQDSENVALTRLGSPRDCLFTLARRLRPCEGALRL